MVRRAALTRAGGAILLGIILAASVSIVQDNDQSSLLLRGDFPAFYAAGKIVAIGRGGELYNPSLQLAIQQEAWPSLGRDNFYAFAYPPYVALLFAPLSALPPTAAKLVWTALMLAVLAAGAYVSARNSAYSTKQHLLLYLGCTPVFIGVMSGQNVAISMLCYSILLSPNFRGRSDAAGYVLGLWCFKPHFAAIAAGSLLLAGKTRQILVAAGILVLLYILGSLIHGSNWPTAWYQTARGFAALDFDANRHQQLSLQVILTIVSGQFLANPGQVQVVAITATVLLALHLAYECLRARKGENALDRALMLVGPGIVLLSPHTMFYDGGIAAVSAVAALERRLVSLRTIAVVWIFLCLTRLFQNYFPFDPLGVLALLLYCVISRSQR